MKNHNKLLNWGVARPLVYPNYGQLMHKIWNIWFCSQSGNEKPADSNAATMAITFSATFLVVITFVYPQFTIPYFLSTFSIKYAAECLKLFGRVCVISDVRIRIRIRISSPICVSLHLRDVSRCR